MSINLPHALKASSTFWLVHMLGFVLYMGVNRCFDFYYNQHFSLPLSLLVTEFVLITSLILVFRTTYWQLGWHKRGIFALLPALLIGSWLLAFAWQVVWQWQAFGDVLTAFGDARAPQWREEAMRTFIGSWSNHFYMFFSWAALYCAVAADRNGLTNQPSPEFDISNRTTRLSVLCTALPLSAFIAYGARCWSEIPMAMPSVAIAALVFIPAVFFFLQCCLLIRFDSSIGNSRLLAQLPLLIGLVPAIAIIMSGVQNATNAIIVNILQPHLLVDAQAMNTALVDASTATAGAFERVNRHAGYHLGWLNQQLNMVGLAALVIFIAHYFNKAPSLSPASRLLNWQQFIKSSAPSFWLYNLSGWSILAFYFSVIQVWELAQLNIGLNIFVTIATVIAGILYSPYMRQMLKSYSFLDTNPIIFVFKILLICIAVGLASACILNTLSWLYVFAMFDDVQYLAYEKIAREEFLFLGNWAFYIGAYFLWCLFYSISVTYRNKKQADVQAIQMEADLKEAQLNTLSGQLDPHFIFNAINNIRALVKEDGEKARAALVTLSDILRSSVYKKSKLKTRVSDEIVLVNNYIALAQIQHEERLRYSETIHPNAMPAFIPPMVLQMLVENAIKHGISHLPDGGDLHLNISQQGNQLTCFVANSGVIEQHHSREGFGIGVSNIQARISLLYGNRGHFSLTMQPRADNPSEQWVVATLTIPYETNLHTNPPSSALRGEQ